MSTSRKKPDSFRENEVDLKPLVPERNRLYALWLTTGNESDRKRHAAVQRVVGRLCGTASRLPESKEKSDA